MSMKMEGDQLTLFDSMQFVGVPPTRAYPDDAGFDLVCNEDARIEPHGMGRIPLATQIKSPRGYWGLILGRSSTFWRGLLVNPGVIDEGYTGPLFAVVHNMTDHVVEVLAGERIVQWIPLPTHTIAAMAVDSLPPTERGHNGFGSSGK